MKVTRLITYIGDTMEGIEQAMKLIPVGTLPLGYHKFDERFAGVSAIRVEDGDGLELLEGK